MNTKIITRMLHRLLVPFYVVHTLLQCEEALSNTKGFLSVKDDVNFK